MTREEAIEVYRGIINQKIKEAFEFFAPGLKESEDERIRKQIEQALIEHDWSATYKVSKDDCLAYLEKQKEQKPLTTEETELNSIAFLEQLGYICIPPEAHKPAINGDDVAWFDGLKQDLEHPEELDEKVQEVLKKRKKPSTPEDIAAAYQMGLAEGRRKQKPAEKQDYSGLSDLERAIHRGFLAAGVENVPVSIIKETVQECLAQMKPAEWSEEDKRMINDIIVTISMYANGEIPLVLPSELLKYAERLKSLRPQPHWKPSEEQMEALNAINCHGDLSYMGQQSQLISLYNDLKKLKGGVAPMKDIDE